MARLTKMAVYNSRIASMFISSSLRSVYVVLILPVLLLNATAWGQNWSAAEEQLAKKIVEATGPRTMVVEVTNRSAGISEITSTNLDGIRRGILTELTALGARVVDSEPAEATITVSLTENLQSYVWVAEIHLAGSQASNQISATEPAVVMVSFPRTGTETIRADAAALVLHKTLLWTQPERILDVAVVDRSERKSEGGPAQMLVLDSRGVVSYRLQNGQWQAEQTLPVAHSRPWPRDLRGRLDLRKDGLFDVYLPGVYCRSTAGFPLSLTCNQGDDNWPIGTGLFNLNASFVSARNYFSGALLPGVGKQMTTAPFYSAAAFPRGQSVFWLFTAVDGTLHMLDGATDQVIQNPGWGSDIASVRSGCGSGSQVLASGKADGPRDGVRASEVPGHEPIAASTALDLPGTITGMWTESGETGAVAVIRNSDTGGYEAYRLTVTCDR
jgi:hypothetical protein